MDALHANFVYGATASNAPVPAGYSVFDNNGNAPFGIFGTWSAAHSKPTAPSRIRGLSSHFPVMSPAADTG